jgi:hypothetical protein
LLKLYDLYDKYVLNEETPPTNDLFGGAGGVKYEPFFNEVSVKEFCICYIIIIYNFFILFEIFFNFGILL